MGANEDWITDFLADANTTTNFEIDFPATDELDPDHYIHKDNECHDESLFQSFSPVSVLDDDDKGGSSSSSSSSSSSTETTAVNVAQVGANMIPVPARARSKRPRKAAPLHVVTVPILPTPLPPSFDESPCPFPMKKKTKKSALQAVAEDGGAQPPPLVRRCMHCGIQKTPQWRAGPMGPKTLCNACGVRYKSGRLFPEYRPAASPTFVPTIHSNSHKKVVEMRNKACEQMIGPSPENPAAKNCDLLAYIRRRE